jgi:hypothetical protein
VDQVRPLRVRELVEYLKGLEDQEAFVMFGDEYADYLVAGADAGVVGKGVSVYILEKAVGEDGYCDVNSLDVYREAAGEDIGYGR